MTIRAFLAALVAFIAIGAPVRADDSILVIDASGSMWGQIDEEAKIAIAKRVLGVVVDDLPAERRLGLIAYGHRREGDCKDIEELVPVGADRAAVKTAIDKLSPKGKTPMSDSVKLAAEKLQYTSNKATVILVSDGIETCEPDPCGVAAALEAAGVDLTVHVVGFDVKEENAQAQLKCIAENTGGAFIAAADAGALLAALETTVVKPPAATTENLYLRATELEGGIEIEKGLAWTVTPAGGGAPVVSEADAGRVEAIVPPGTYDVAVARASDGLKGEAKGVVVQPNASKTVTIALVFDVAATIRVEPAAQAMAGTNIKAHWEGPNRRGDFIAIAKKDDAAGATLIYGYARNGNPVELRLPVETGVYEVRYVLGSPYRILARADIEATQASATIEGPASAVAGGEIAVDFTGPPAGSGDFVTITKPDAPENKYEDYAYTRNGSPAKLRAPLEAGDFELRFVQNNRKVLARQAIAVTAAEATLAAAAEAGAGESVKVEFTGPPAGSGDWITVVKADDPGNKYNDYAYVRNGSPAEIRMPLEAGDYEIRYVQGGSKVLARQTITVRTVAANVSAKATAIAGETLTVEFSGPAPESGDYITVTEPGAPENKFMDYAYTRSGSPAKIRMPLDAGDYEIRFVQGGKKVIARQTVSVTSASATLDGPASAKANELIEVAFTGPPPGSGDYVVVSAKDAPDLKYVTYGYVSSGSPAKVRMPKEPGAYELRYVHGNKKVLARRPITVTP